MEHDADREARIIAKQSEVAAMLGLRKAYPARAGRPAKPVYCSCGCGGAWRSRDEAARALRVSLRTLMRALAGDVPEVRGHRLSASRQTNKERQVG